jgi:hypothetical protein
LEEYIEGRSSDIPEECRPIRGLIGDILAEEVMKEGRAVLSDNR